MSFQLLLTGSLLQNFQTGIPLKSFGKRTHTFILETVLLQAGKSKRENPVDTVTFIREEDVMSIRINLLPPQLEKPTSEKIYIYRKSENRESWGGEGFHSGGASGREFTPGFLMSQ